MRGRTNSTGGSTHLPLALFPSPRTGSKTTCQTDRVGGSLGRVAGLLALSQSMRGSTATRILTSHKIIQGEEGTSLVNSGDREATMGWQVGVGGQVHPGLRHSILTVQDFCEHQCLQCQAEVPRHALPAGGHHQHHHRIWKRGRYMSSLRAHLSFTGDT